MTYTEARVYLDSMSKYGSVLGLDTIRELLHELGDPQNDLTFIHIAGTNGKGSVLAYTSTILSEAGYKTGRYVSPTVVSYLERIQINGNWISETDFSDCMDTIQEAIARIEAQGHTCPTVFEIETAIAFLYFKKEKCDFIVLECGLGGELDATNIIPSPLCAAFASISCDHLGILGNTLEEIAQTKSGIIKSGCSVVTGPQDPRVLQILKDKAASCNCPVCIADSSQIELIKDTYEGLILSYGAHRNLHGPLAGRHQANNIITALEILHVLQKKGYSIEESAICSGLKKTSWPGRFSLLGKDPLFFIDGAHNEEAARRLKEAIDTYFPDKKCIFIMGVFKDKDYAKIASIMAPAAHCIYTVSLPNKERTLPAEQLANVLRNYTDKEVIVVPSLIEAMKQAFHQADIVPDSPILAFGSLSYLGEIMDYYKQLTT